MKLEFTTKSNSPATDLVGRVVSLNGVKATITQSAIAQLNLSTVEPMETSEVELELRVGDHSEEWFEDAE